MRTVEAISIMEERGVVRLEAEDAKLGSLKRYARWVAEHDGELLLEFSGDVPPERIVKFFEWANDEFSVKAIVRHAELPVYVLGLSSGSPFAATPAGEKLFRYADALNLLASLTGGRYHPVAGPEDLKEACAAIADDLRYQYVLSFPTRATGPMAFHRLSVEIPRRSNLRILTREGYDGTAPAP